MRSGNAKPRAQDTPVFEVGATWADTFIAVDREWRITFAVSPPGGPTAVPEEARGRLFWDVLRRKDDASLPIFAEYRRCMDARARVEFVEHAADGGARTAVRAFPTSDGGIAVFYRDVTAHDTALAELTERSNFEQQLLGIVSHDLRNPLQTIKLSAELALGASAMNARERRAFERIERAARRAGRMIDDLLDFTRVRLGGGFTVNRLCVDLRAVVAVVVEEILITYPERRIEIDADGDTRGFWDADRLSQIVQNLVGNAVQHTTEDVRVRVSTRADGGDVILEVHNGGDSTIPEEDLMRLFEPFHRGRGTRARSGRSLGLGLFITSQIVRAHGGTVGVTSRPGVGTTFIVRLPRGEPDSPESETVEAK
ncbi:MAG: HAMP domain-containing sensor histidine kinase [Polyangiaceae bacterium]